VVARLRSSGVRRGQPFVGRRPHAQTEEEWWEGLEQQPERNPGLRCDVER
jgi:hypothetical protein